MLSNNDEFIVSAIEGNQHRPDELVNDGQDSNILNSYGITLLLQSAGLDRSGVVSFLLANGAELNLREEHGRTTLMKAAQHVNLNVVSLMFTNGADGDL